MNDVDEEVKKVPRSKVEDKQPKLKKSTKQLTIDNESIEKTLPLQGIETPKDTTKKILDMA